MELSINEDRFLVMKKVFTPIVLITAAGEEMMIYMRDSGFEFTYQNNKYFAKEGHVEPFHYSVRGNELVDQHHNGSVDVANFSPSQPST